MARTKVTTAKIAEGKKWSVLSGDAKEVCKTLEAESFHAVLCDPPYGLKPGRTCTWDDIEAGRADAKGGFMGKAWDSAVPGPSLWREVLRVMKPGAPLVAFFGTRTYHRGACAIEDAGFLPCDMFSWLYGQGWPKGLDMAKAFDKRRHDRTQILVVTKWLAEQRDRAGVTNGDIDAAFGLHGMAGHWTTQKSQPLVPTLEQLPKLFEVLKIQEVPDEIRELLIELNGRKGEHGEAWKTAEITGWEEGKDRTLAAPVAKAAQDKFVGSTPMKNYATKAPNSELAKEWAGYNTQLKPACEPAAVMRKPFPGTFTRNAEEHGCGPYNVDASRIGYADEADLANTKSKNQGTSERVDSEVYNGNRPAQVVNTRGRYPTNVLLAHLPGCRMVGTKPSNDPVMSTESTKNENSTVRYGGVSGSYSFKSGTRPDEAVWECEEGCAVARLDEQSGNRPGGIAVQRNGGGGKFFSGLDPSKARETAPRPDTGYADDGGASRYYFQSSWQPGELEAVAEAFERFYFCAKVSDGERGSENKHPTVKPIALMRYLATLLRPPRPGSRILVPFCGSGSEMLGAMLAGWDEVVGIELDPAMADVARWRIENAVIRSTTKEIR